MEKTITFLNEEHDIVPIDQAYYLVETITDAEGRVANETWVTITEVDGVLTQLGEILADD